MDLLIIIISFILAYSLFVFVAYKLAQSFFPRIIDEDELEIKPRKVRQRPSKRLSM